MKTENPNCDGAHCLSASAEVRLLPTSGQSNLILCRACYEYEMQFRRERNRQLAESNKFEIPLWESLKVYV